MATDKCDESCKRKSYTIKVKLEACDYAEMSSNEKADNINAVY